MSFTNLTLVKKHLLQSAFGLLEISAIPATLIEYSELELPHHNIVENTEVVKRVETLAPYEEGYVQLSGYNWRALSRQHLVEGSPVVTLGDTFTTIYVEEKDYIVDYPTGKIRRVPGTTIPDSQPLTVFYYAYRLFSRDTDYEFDPVLGTMCRSVTSAIPDGGHVLIQYSVTAGSVTDDLILEAITEAEDRIVRSLSGDYSASSADQGLKTGATELVMAILARDLAGDTLARRLTTDGAPRAKEWLNLSGMYETRAWQTLSPFLDPFALHSSEKRTNG